MKKLITYVIFLMLAIRLLEAHATPTFAGCSTEFPQNAAGNPFYPQYQSLPLLAGGPLPPPATILIANASINVGADTIRLMCKSAATPGTGVYAGSIAAVAFNGNRGIPDWVSYRANLGRTVAYTGGSTQTLTRDGSQFYMDPELKALGVKQAAPYTYQVFNSLPGGVAGGYAKGHYMPSHASLYDPQAQDVSFSFANAAPQHPSMNSGVWSYIENWVNQGALANKTLIVTTGSYGRAYANSLGPAAGFVSNIGPFPNYQAAIPACFYKVIYQPLTNEAIAFLVPNTNTAGAGTWQNYVITVNDLERRMLLAAQNPPAGQAQQGYSIIFPLPAGANKNWPVTDIHWPRNGAWPGAGGVQSSWYIFPGGAPAPAPAPVLRLYPVSRIATFPGC